MSTSQDIESKNTEESSPTPSLPSLDHSPWDNRTKALSPSTAFTSTSPVQMVQSTIPLAEGPGVTHSRAFTEDEREYISNIIVGSVTTQSSGREYGDLLKIAPNIEKLTHDNWTDWDNSVRMLLRGAVNHDRAIGIIDDEYTASVEAYQRYFGVPRSGQTNASLLSEIIAKKVRAQEDAQLGTFLSFVMSPTFRSSIQSSAHGGSGAQIYAYIKQLCNPGPFAAERIILGKIKALEDKPVRELQTTVDRLKSLFRELESQTGARLTQTQQVTHLFTIVRKLTHMQATVHNIEDNVLSGRESYTFDKVASELVTIERSRRSTPIIEDRDLSLHPNEEAYRRQMVPMIGACNTVDVSHRANASSSSRESSPVQPFTPERGSPTSPSNQRNCLNCNGYGHNASECPTKRDSERTKAQYQIRRRQGDPNLIAARFVHESSGSWNTTSTGLDSLEEDGTNQEGGLFQY